MNRYIEEEITLAEFSERFLKNNDFATPTEYDLEPHDIEVLTQDKDGNDVYKQIKSFVVKPPVNYYYTDGNLKCSGNHRIIENNNNILAKEHDEFYLVNKPLHIVDIEVADEHSYLANGRLNHNTTSGGKALGFHSSVRIRLSSIKKLKESGTDDIVGIRVKAVIFKNRIGPPFRQAEFDIYFDRGIQDINSWFEFLKKQKIVSGKGWYTLPYKGEEFKFQQKGFEDLLTKTDGLSDYIYDLMCERLILTYQDNVQRDPEKVKVEGDEIKD